MKWRMDLKKLFKSMKTRLSGIKNVPTIVHCNVWQTGVCSPVKNGAVVVSLLGQLYEIFTGFRDRVTVELQVQVS
jgi:hypothetical protein